MSLDRSTITSGPFALTDGLVFALAAALTAGLLALLFAVYTAGLGKGILAAQKAGEEALRESKARADSLQEANERLKRRIHTQQKQIRGLKRKLLREVTAMAKAMNGEGAAGREQRMIAWVIRNRVESRHFPGTPRRVVREPMQFSSMIGPDPDATPAAIRAARGVLAAPPEADPTRGATHFYSPRSMRPEGTAPRWASALEEVRVPGIDPYRFRFFKRPDADAQRS